MNPSNSAKERLVQTFKFLKELNELRNPVPRDLSGAEVLRLDAWPAHPCIQVRRGDREEDDNGATAEAEMEPLIRIQRARLTQCPKPPEVLDGWLKPGWQSVDQEADVLKSRNFQAKKKRTVTVAFEDDRKRVAALNEWMTARAQWVLAEQPVIRQFPQRGIDMKTIVEVKSTDYWFKIVEMLQQNWALLDKINESSACIVYFLHAASGVFDRIQFSSVEEAFQALRRNGFARFSEDTQAQKMIAPPQPPFYEAQHPNGPIYSSGRYWR